MLAKADKTCIGKSCKNQHRKCVLEKMLTDGEFDAVPIFEVVVQQTKPSVSDN